MISKEARSLLGKKTVSVPKPHKVDDIGSPLQTEQDTYGSWNVEPGEATGVCRSSVRVMATGFNHPDGFVR